VEVNHINHSFNREEKVAGNDWLIGFCKRHSEISLRSQEATSAARAQAFNKPKVQNYSEVSEKTIAENNITKENIYNGRMRPEYRSKTSLQKAESKLVQQRVLNRTRGSLNCS